MLFAFIIIICRKCHVCCGVSSFIPFKFRLQTINALDNAVYFISHGQWFGGVFAP